MLLEVNDQQTLPSSEKLNTPQLAVNHLSSGQPPDKNEMETASTVSGPSTQGSPVPKAKGSKVADVTLPKPKKRPFISSIPEHMQHVLSSASTIKRSKMSEEDKQNKKDVVEKGGQCVNCKVNHSKVSDCTNRELRFL
jgi:hypothetical protein